MDSLVIFLPGDRVRMSASTRRGFDDGRFGFDDHPRGTVEGVDDDGWLRIVWDSQLRGSVTIDQVELCAPSSITDTLQRARKALTALESLATQNRAWRAKAGYK